MHQARGPGQLARTLPRPEQRCPPRAAAGARPAGAGALARLTSLRCPFTARGSHAGAAAHLDGVRAEPRGQRAASERRSAGGRRPGGPPCGWVS